MSGEAPSPRRQRVLHQTIKKVTEDIEALKFNTAIAQMMVFVNELTRLERRPRAVLEPFVLVLAPFAPHLAEELWRRLGHAESLAYAALAGVRPGAVRRGHRHGRRAGQRQAACHARSGARRTTRMRRWRPRSPTSA